MAPAPLQVQDLSPTPCHGTSSWSSTSPPASTHGGPLWVSVGYCRRGISDPSHAPCPGAASPLASAPPMLAGHKEWPQQRPLLQSYWCVRLSSPQPAPPQPWTACIPSSRPWISDSPPRMRVTANSCGPPILSSPGGGWRIAQTPCRVVDHRTPAIFYAGALLFCALANSNPLSCGA